MTWPRLSALLASSWARPEPKLILGWVLLTVGVGMAVGYWRVVLPLSAGIAFVALGVIELREMMADELDKKDEADK